jgi:diguanylate cyclase (GGDEF)-like protein
MKQPRIPQDETQRLRTLQSLQILDTPADERFDQITRMARRLFDVPIALVSLVDEKRQWFKSRQGLDVTETPRELSFCGHAILDDALFIVEDATQDERFHDNPLVCSTPDIRFYAGCPLRAPNGQRLGTLCVIDLVPRTFSATDREMLHDLGTLAEQQLRSLTLATMDELTRIPNRRGFGMFAERILATCARARISAVAVLFDLNDFKLINDREGHGSGDRALQEFARCLLVASREGDVIARLGGDEFCALMVNARREDAARLIERIGRLVAELNAEKADRLPLAFSAGVAACDGAAAGNVDDLLAEADRQMFGDKVRRKSSGAGRVPAPGP